MRATPLLQRERSVSSSGSKRRRRHWMPGILLAFAAAVIMATIVLHQHAAHAVGALVAKQLPHHTCQKHPRFWRDDVQGATRTAYTKAAADCYRTRRKHNVAVTTLLPDRACPGRYPIHDALKRLSASISNILVNNPADVLLFHTGWTDLDLQAVKAVMPDAHALCIATEHWMAPRTIRPWEAVTGDEFGAGYRSMCRWYSIHLFEALQHMGYEWVIRLDDDSVFPHPIPYNLVSLMEANGAEYGYRADSYDASEVLQALPEAARYWLKAENIRPSWLLHFCLPQDLSGLSSEGWSGTIFYNNFFITRVDWWMQPHIQAWLAFLLDLGGFYKFRWGDAPVHTITMGMFMSDDLILQFGFEYEHQQLKYSLNQFSQQFFANVVFNGTHGALHTPTAHLQDSEEQGIT